MPFGYLITVAILALCTLLALSPLRRPRALSGPSYWLGMALNELPFLAFCLLLASTLIAFAQGDVDSPSAWAAVGVAALATLGLVEIVSRGLEAGPAVAKALEQGLGEEWRYVLPDPLASGLRRRLPLVRILLAPLPVWPPRAVRRVSNLSYGDAGRRNLLDVYHRRDMPRGGPVLIHFHGGRFRSGRKSREARPLLHRLASRGWVCISANYRLTPEAAFPDYLVDFKKVIAWAREHAGELGADPDLLFAAGSSAGAHIASMAALTANDPRFQPGFEQADTSVSGAVGLYGYYGALRTHSPPSSPAAYVGPDSPPFFLAHGDRDTVVKAEGARRLAAALRERSAGPVVYAELPGAQHGFDLFHSLRMERVVDGVEAFAARVRADLAGEGAQPAGEPASTD